METDLIWGKTREEIQEITERQNAEHKVAWAPWERFHARLKSIGLLLEGAHNVPWIYLEKINGKYTIAEPFMSDHGFTMAFSPIRPGDKVKFTDRRKIFTTIRDNIGTSGFWLRTKRKLRKKFGRIILLVKGPAS